MFTSQEAITIRKPEASDGREIHQLISNCPPLDLNSVYSYYLLSDHFRDSCAVAETDGKVVGFVSAYRIPQRPDTLFIWQVVVDQTMRGHGVAWRMLASLLQRFPRNEVRQVEATVNPSNSASRGLFDRLALEHGSQVEEAPYLDATAFGCGSGHESEILLRIPLHTRNS